MFMYLLEKYSKYFDDHSCWLSGERSLPFGLLVCTVDLAFILHDCTINFIIMCLILVSVKVAE